MKDQFNEIIGKINFSIKSLNVHYSLFQSGTPVGDVPYLVKSPTPHDIPALGDLLRSTASVCRAYEQELWKDKWDTKMIGKMSDDIIQRRDLLTGIIKDLN